MKETQHTLTMPLTMLESGDGTTIWLTGYPALIEQGKTPEEAMDNMKRLVGTALADYLSNQR